MFKIKTAYIKNSTKQNNIYVLNNSGEIKLAFPDSAIEEESEIELDIAVTEMAAKTGHAALIHHPDGSYTIAIPTLTFEANSTGLETSEQNEKSLNTLIEVLTTDDRISGMTVSVFGYINPDSRSENWTGEEKELSNKSINNTFTKEKLLCLNLTFSYLTL